MLFRSVSIKYITANSFDVMKHLLPILFLVATTASFAINEDAYNDFTIRAEDIPRDAPKFSDYPVARYGGKNAKPDLSRNTPSWQFRTRISKWGLERPNFAGHYVLATWGCGTDCTQLTIIDAINGKVYHPEGIRSNVAVNVHQSLLDGSSGWREEGSVKFTSESSLLVVVGMPEERAADRGISYFLWRNNRMERVKFVHKAWYP